MPDRRNRHGSFIWHELPTADPDSAAAFYGDAIGWTAASAGQPGIDYRLFRADGTASDPRGVAFMAVGPRD
ncbi:MAG: hypothetical protein ACXW27_02510 [Allosphingosinicella sp.]